MSNDGDAWAEARRVIDRIAEEDPALARRAESAWMEEYEITAAADVLREAGREGAALEIEYADHCAYMWNYGIDPEDWEEWVRSRFVVATNHQPR